jgi:GNAT superfamily N-acetyltransferase
MKLSEIDKLTEGAREFFSESDIFRGEFNIDYFKDFWFKAYDLGIGIIFILVDENDDVQGAIGGAATTDCITGILASTEAFWYVRKGYRGKFGIILLNKYEQWAKSLGCKKIRMAHLVDLMPAKLKQFYEKRGYRKIETIFEKENT